MNEPQPPHPEEIGHAPVLIEAVKDLLDPSPGQKILDATLGRGGHAAALIPEIAPGGTYIGLDADPGNAAFARDRLTPIAQKANVQLHVVHANFVSAPQIIDSLGVSRIDGLLADLGFASNQMDDPDRGFSFQADGPLDMRLDPTLAVSAADLCNTLSEKDLADLIFQYGEERLSRRIAKKIMDTRPIRTTSALAELCCRAYGPAGRKYKIHPATRTFMALRIAVNDELRALEELLAAIPDLLAPAGRAAIISFHSLEDRRVKHTFREWKQAGKIELLTKKPIEADMIESARNPRSRSAKLRGIAWR